MLSQTLLGVGILGVIWLATGLVVSVRYRTVGVNLHKLALCAVIILVTFVASVTACYNGW